MTGEQGEWRYENLSPEDKALVIGYMRRLVDQEPKLESLGQFEKIMNDVNTAKITQAAAANMLLAKIKREHTGRDVMDVIRKLSPDNPSTTYAERVAESRKDTESRGV